MSRKKNNIEDVESMKGDLPYNPFSSQMFMGNFSTRSKKSLSFLSGNPSDREEEDRMFSFPLPPLPTPVTYTPLSCSDQGNVFDLEDFDTDCFDNLTAEQICDVFDVNKDTSSLYTTLFQEEEEHFPFSQEENENIDFSLGLIEPISGDHGPQTLIEYNDTLDILNTSDPGNEMQNFLHVLSCMKGNAESKDGVTHMDMGSFTDTGLCTSPQTMNMEEIEVLCDWSLGMLSKAMDSTDPPQEPVELTVLEKSVIQVAECLREASQVSDQARKEKKESHIDRLVFGKRAGEKRKPPKKMVRRKGRKRSKTQTKLFMFFSGSK